MMQVVHEMPLALLESGLEKQINGSLFYALVHLFEKYPKYYKYVVQALHEGRHIILDNSAYELRGAAVSAPILVTWITRLVQDTSPAIIDNQLTYVLPDVFDDPTQTYQQAVDFLWENPDLPGRAMGVLQGVSFLELEEMVRQYREIPRISKIGINFMSQAYLSYIRRTEHDADSSLSIWTKRMIARRAFIESLYHKGLLNSLPVHLLGAALPNEFIYYTKEHPALAAYIDTIDTSAPVVYGMFLGIYKDLDSLDVKPLQKIAEYMEEPITKEQEEAIVENVRLFRKYTFGS